ncbi:hypothetical protein [Amorphus sp. MBR-141]
MFRKSMIALATVATLGAASVVPATAGPTYGHDARTGSVQVYDSRNGHHDARDVGRNYQVQKHNQHAKPQKVCSVQKVRTVQWTKHGKVVRLVPKTDCHYVNYRPR